jgi:hypothetical protein
MKYLTTEAYEFSLNAKRGLKLSKEEEYIAQSVDFLYQMAVFFHVGNTQISTALYTFNIFMKEHSFNEFDRYRIAAVCLFTSCKIEYQPRKIEDFLRYLWDNAPVANKNLRKNQKLEDKITKMKEDFIKDEFRVILVIGLDFEFESPFDYLKAFHKNYMDQKVIPLLMANSMK